MCKSSDSSCLLSHLPCVWIWYAFSCWSIRISLFRSHFAHLFTKLFIVSPSMILLLTSLPNFLLTSSLSTWLELESSRRYTSDHVCEDSSNALNCGKKIYYVSCAILWDGIQNCKKRNSWVSELPSLYLITYSTINKQSHVLVTTAKEKTLPQWWSVPPNHKPKWTPLPLSCFLSGVWTKLEEK